jgi:hypothetical protein
MLQNNTINLIKYISNTRRGLIHGRFNFPLEKKIICIHSCIPSQNSRTTKQWCMQRWWKIKSINTFQEDHTWCDRVNESKNKELVQTNGHEATGLSKSSTIRGCRHTHVCVCVRASSKREREREREDQKHQGQIDIEQWFKSIRHWYMLTKINGCVW